MTGTKVGEGKNGERLEGLEARLVESLDDNVLMKVGIGREV